MRSSHMASPTMDASASSTFPKRKRRSHLRESDGGSFHSQPQKKRSKIETDTFQQPLQTAHANGLPSNGRASMNNASGPTLEIPWRSKSHRRSAQDDHPQSLTETSAYSAKSIPGLPDQLRNLHQTSFRVWLSPSSRLVLATTVSRAFIWDRSTGLHSPTARIFNIPTPSFEGLPIPLGALVTSPEARETGLVVVTASAGKIFYWQNIEDAEALSLFEKNRNGLEGSISLMTGESVDRIEAAGHAGFLLVTSAGRTAQLLLRDLQSRPSITVNFLRGDGNHINSGFLSGLKNAIVGSNWLRNVRAAKARSSKMARGQMDVLLANEDARFQSWKLGWSGQIEFIEEIDAQKVVRDTVLQSLQTNPEQSSSTQVKVFDFAFSNDRHTIRKRRDSTEQCFSVILLVGLVAPTATSFALTELTILDGKPLVGSILHLRSYMAPLVIGKRWKPTLILSESSLTGCVVFDKAISIVSIARPSTTDTGSSVLEETLHLRDDEDTNCVGANVEEDRHAERAGHTVFSVFVRSHGLIKFLVSEPLDYAEASQRGALSIEDRIRQAVFFGSKATTPFDFTKVAHHDVKTGDIEEAAIRVSAAILCNDTPGSQASDTIIHQSLSVRIGFMHNLARHLKSTYPRLSRKVRWKLLWDAEKVAAAEEVWRVFDSRRSSNEEAPRFLPDLIEQMSDSYRADRDEEKGEIDDTRQFFLKSLKNMDALLFWTYKALSEDLEHGEVDPESPTFAQYLSDAVEIAVAILGTAFKFRQESAYAYNLDNEPLNGALLETSSYRGLVSPWTSEAAVILEVLRLLDASLEYVLSLTDVPQILDSTIKEAADRIVDTAPALIDVLNIAFSERIRCLAQSSNADRRVLSNDINTTRREMLLQDLPRLLALDQVEVAYAIGEKYAEMPALVALFREEVAIAQTNPDPREMQKMLDRLEGRQRQWFDKFGQEWANEFYGNLFEHRRYMSLLNQASSNKAELTRFLRSDISRAKISWINEVVVEGDFMRAGRQLLGSASRQVTDRVNKAEDEVALAKLCLLAAKESDELPLDFEEVLTACEHSTVLANAKSDIIEQVKDSGNSGVDREAGVQLITNDFCLEAPESTLGQMFHSAFESLWLRDAPPTADALLDILTLMRPVVSDPPSEQDLSDHILSVALQILHKPNINKDSALYQLVWSMTWRRIFIRDDWAKVNRTQEQSDAAVTAALEETELYSVLYRGYKDGLLSEPDGVRLPQPLSIIGHGTQANDHQCRFQDESICDKLAAAFAKEDETLQDYTDHHRLEHWVATAARMASGAVQDEKDLDEDQRDGLARMVEKLFRDDEEEYANDVEE